MQGAVPGGTRPAEGVLRAPPGRRNLRLVACGTCHRQFDVTHVTDPELSCPCGAKVANEVHAPIDARVVRCGSCGAGLGEDAEVCDYCAAPVVREGALSLLCPECFARNAEDSRFCTACGVGFDPQPVVAGEHELPCPDCGGLMPSRQVGDIPANECPNCNGLWVAGDRFEQLVARAVDAVRKAEEGELPGRAPRRAGANPYRQSVRYRKCPVCEAFMHRKNYRKCSGVILDHCHDHGTWLDADELEAIAGFILEQGGVPPEPALEPLPQRPRPDFQMDWSHERRGGGGLFGRSVLGLIWELLD